jgi:hypothetical protein
MRLDLDQRMQVALRAAAQLILARQVGNTVTSPVRSPDDSCRQFPLLSRIHVPAMAQSRKASSVRPGRAQSASHRPQQASRPRGNGSGGSHIIRVGHPREDMPKRPRTPKTQSAQIAHDSAQTIDFYKLSAPSILGAAVQRDEGRTIGILRPNAFPRSVPIMEIASSPIFFDLAIPVTLPDRTHPTRSGPPTRERAITAGGGRYFQTVQSAFGLAAVTGYRADHAARAGRSGAGPVLLDPGAAGDIGHLRPCSSRCVRHALQAVCCGLAGQ